MKNSFLPRAIAILVVVFGLVAGSSSLNIPAGAVSNASSQSMGEIRRNAQRIPGQYIVVFHDDVEPASAAYGLASAHNGSVGFIYRHALNGFSISVPEAAAIAISKNPQVKYVEEDGIVSVTATQSNATWGLDRIDQRDRPLDTFYSYNATGAGINAYILDTGIRTSHTEFGIRASVGFDSVGDGRNGSDCNGHGTHVAGTVGGTTYGVAKSVNLIAVRVLNCQGSGTWSGVIAGIDWVTANHVKPAVANMSLGGGANSSVDTAVQNSIAAGVTYVVAAGNSNANACNSSPARVPAALTIGATTSTDAKASYSNFGSCVDLFAPGSSITSAWYTSNTAINTISGTSMASPHVAGAAALYLETSPGASPSEVEQAIESNATPNKITGLSGTPNLLLYTLNFGGGTTPPPNNPPTSSFTFSTTGLTASFNGSGSTDSDGTITTYSWNFGDGTNGSGVTVNHTYAVAGTYSVTLTVTDDDGATDSASQSVTVNSSSSGITLSAVGYKVKGLQTVDLTWSGASSTSVDIFRNGSKITTTTNGGFYTDNINSRGGGTYRYRVCEAGTSACSNEVTVTF